MRNMPNFDTDRCVLLWDNIDPNSSRAVVEQLLSIGGTKPVNLLINSSGGSIYDAFGIIETFKLVPYKVNAIVMGNAFSAAFVILACATGKRIASENSRMMFHPIAAEVGYTDHVDANIISQEFNVTWATVSHMLTEATGGIINIDTFSNRDVYLSPHECLNLGVIDRIFSQVSDLDGISDEVKRN